MKWCVEFPEETILVIRPSLKRICLNVSPAANLLSVLLYRHSIRKEASDDAQNLNDAKRARGDKADQDTSFRIYRKQAQIVTDACGELTERTLHDTAVPTLQLLGYLEVEELPGCNRYILHMDKINEAMNAHKKGLASLKLFYKSMPQLETFLIDVQYEKFRIDRQNFVSQLEKVRIGNRNISNCKRGRKPKSEVVGDGNSSGDRLEEDCNTDYIEDKRDTYTDVPSEIGAPSLSPLSLLLESWRTGSQEEQQSTLQVLIDAGIVPSPQSENGSHSSEPLETSLQDTDSTTLEVSLAPSQQAENASVSQETHNSTPLSENASQVAKQEASNVDHIADEVEKPAKKARKSRKVLDFAPTLPPARPDEDAPWTVEKCLAWGDYARKCVFAPSNLPQSKYYKSVEASKKIIGQGIPENTFLSVYLNWMKGVNLNLEALPEGAIRSETWLNYSVDLWVFIEHYEDEARKYKKAKLAQVFQVPATTPIDISTQRENARIKNLANIEKMNRIKAKLDEERQQQAGKKRAAL